MASFVDAIPQFNPYISQLPVEEMAKVGMQKQEQYNQGIQKIQSNIDNIAGLDVIRDVDKQYLQSKLNSLGNKLKTVAAGDFSNFQLTNSVSGMTNQIAKDKNVLNAVSSTMKYRKEIANLEKARQDGKSSIANEWVFNEGASGWLNSQDVNQSFNTSYTPYIDVQKKWLEVFKGLHPDLNEQDISYVTNFDGTINYKETGAAMQRISKETVSQAQIENALRVSMSPNELNQLSINGRYEFRQYDTPEKLVVYSQSKYSEKTKQIDNKIKDLKAQAVQFENNPAKKEQYENSIKFLEEKKSYLPSLLQQELELIQQDLEQSKYNIYKNGAIEQFASAYSWENNKLNFVNNPIKQQENWERTYKLSQDEFNWKKERARLQDLKDLQEEEDKQNNQFVASGGRPINDIDSYVDYRDDILSKNENAEAIFNKTLDLYFENAKINNPSLDKVTAAKHLRYNIEEYAKNESTDKLLPKYKLLANSYLEYKKEANFMQSVLDDKRKKIESSPEIQQKYNEFSEELSSVGGGDNIIIPDGNDGTFITNNDILEYVKKVKIYIPYTATSSSLTMGSDGNIKDKQKIDESSLNKKEKYIYNYLNNSNISGPDKIELKKRIQEIRDIDEKHKTLNNTIDDKLREELKPITEGWTPTSSLLDTTEAKKHNKYVGIAQSVLKKFGNDKGQFTGGMKGGDESLTNTEWESLNTWLSESSAGKITFNLTEINDKNYLTVNKGIKSIDIPLTQEERNQLPKNAKVDTRYEKKLYGLREAKGITNITKNPENAWFTKKHMPNIKQLEVKADFEKYPGANREVDNLITYYLNISDNPEVTEWITMQIPENMSMSIRESLNSLNQVSDSNILQLFFSNTDKLTPTQIQKIKNKYPNFFNNK